MTASQTGHPSNALTQITLLPSARQHRSTPIPSTPADLSEACAEILYGEICQRDPHLASRSGKLYEWVGDHWALQDDDLNERRALRWLQGSARKRANIEAARSCVKTAASMVDPVPPKPVHLVVPVNDTWLVLTQGQWLAQAPDRNVGVCHRVASERAIPLGPYTPQPVPAQSLFGRFLDRSLPDKAVQAMVQEYIGYSLTASTAMQLAQMWVGAGSNGKSVLLNIVRALHAKAVAMRLDKLDGFDLTALAGASLVTCDEMPRGGINQQALKSLISGGAVEINPKYRESFTYSPTAKWIVCGNHVPLITDHSHGWWRRFQIVEWTVQLKGCDIIANLDSLIIDHELHIVLDWALEGLSRVIARNFREGALPAPMVKARQNAIAQTNNVQSWVEDCGVVCRPGKYTDKTALWNHYVEYCKKGYSACNASQFYLRLAPMFPSMHEIRQVVGSGEAKRRARCVDLVVGQFDLPASVEENEGKAEENFDPFSEIVAQALAIQKLPAINME